MKKLLIAIFAVIGIVTTIFLGLFFGYRSYADKYTDTKVLKTVPSPSGQFTATYFYESGGGGPGWCSDIISIRPISSPFNMDADRKDIRYQVFRGTCNSIKDIEWVDDSRIKISFTGIDSPGGVSVYMKGRDETGKVIVQYGTHNQAL